MVQGRKEFQDAVEVKEVSVSPERTSVSLLSKMVWQHGMSGDRGLTEIRDCDQKSFPILLDNLSTTAIQKSALLS